MSRCSTTTPRHLESVELRLYRLSDAEAEILLRRGFIDGWSSSAGKRIEFSPASDPIRSWTADIEADLRDASRLYSIALGEDDPLARGHYLLTGQYDNQRGSPNKAVLSVVDTAIVTKLAFDELLVWALDYDTGTPVADVAVRTAPLTDPDFDETRDEWVAWATEQLADPATDQEVAEYESWVAWRTAQLHDSLTGSYQSATTDRDGLVRFAVSPPDSPGYWTPYGQHLVRIDEGGRSGVAATWWDTGASPRELGAASYTPGVVGHVYTDRPHLPAGRDRLLQGRHARRR